MATLVKAAHKHHFDELYLGTVDILHAAQSFYKKYGFSQITAQQLPIEFNICPVNLRDKK
jgi:N-acetylglutamate synthase-like GNAT family acetyltransferase